MAEATVYFVNHSLASIATDYAISQLEARNRCANGGRCCCYSLLFFASVFEMSAQASFI